ncbi:MAG: aspartate--tRNA(Asn) ligase [Actinomycetota bacterium]|nr:aspartate--tRNA(Asn) ligase [Actinomycetota bacterium]
MKRTLVAELGTTGDDDVRLCGWAHAVLVDGDRWSVTLRDHTGTVPLVPGHDAGGELAEEVGGLRRESAIEAVGKVGRAPGAGQPQVLVARLTVAGPATAEPPIGEGSTLEERLDWRFLDLRHPRNRLVFEVQTTLEAAMREVWSDHGFVEIHSPKLKPTPNKSGTELFHVDHFGRPAYLAPSPQFYKQMAMASGFERVFEVGPAFRAQPSPTARHDSEFTSVDVEMSWIESHEDVMAFEEVLLRHALAAVHKEHGDQIARWFGQAVVVPDLPFPRVTLDEAKEAVRASGWPVDPGADDLDPEGERRLSEVVARRHGHEFVFVTDYPELARPYYHMRCEDDSVATRSFDLLWKGLEITSGAQREHRYDRLVNQARLRGLPVRAMSGYLDFFRFGCPPHGGFGIGLSRTLMSLLGIENVREATYLFRGPDRLTP